MPEKRFVLGVDLDGVVGDFYKAMRVVAAEWLGVPIERLTTDVSFGLAEWGLTPERYESMHRFAVTQRALFRDMELIDGAAPALRRLSTEDVHIRIVTHRLFIPYFHQEAVRQTVEWLDYWGIPYRDLCLAGDKVAVGADLYIEDSPRNVEALRTVCPTIVFTNSTNKDIGGLRADDWRAAEEIVLRMRDEWRESELARKKDVSGN
jgi:5'(3')-deoxyribonucleotidase